MADGKLFVISGASGVGKSTVLKHVMAKRPELLFSVSATTRPPRPGEIDGVHYYFITDEKFRQMIDNDEFLEYNYHMGGSYGTPWGQLEEKLKIGDAVLDIEPTGAFNVRKIRSDAVLIFIAPPSLEELERRLRSRGDTSEEQIKVRQARVAWEMEQSKKYDYIVINEVDKAEECAEEILKIIAREAD